MVRPMRSLLLGGAAASLAFVDVAFANRPSSNKVGFLSMALPSPRSRGRGNAVPSHRDCFWGSFASRQFEGTNERYSSDGGTCVRRSRTSSSPVTLGMGYGRGQGRSTPRRGRHVERSKRQERVGHLVRVELARVLQLGRGIEGRNADDSSHLEDGLRRRISVVSTDVSPDLRQARVTVSVVGTDEVEKRRAYSWLVQHKWSIRKELARRLSHMKYGAPDLNFVRADVGAAVDVMALIDRVANDDYKRPSVGMYGGDDDALPSGVHMGIDFDDEGGDDGWIDEDDDGDDDYEEEEGVGDEEDRSKKVSP